MPVAVGESRPWGELITRFYKVAQPLRAKSASPKAKSRLEARRELVLAKSAPLLAKVKLENL